ncbi:MAG: hypothetical protein AVDCRST_MAG67-2926, partial [uncultured Solirubrobacteraceae bacterium]
CAPSCISPTGLASRPRPTVSATRRRNGSSRTRAWARLRGRTSVRPCPSRVSHCRLRRSAQAAGS